MLGDLAVWTAGTLISEDLGIKLESVEVSHLGRAKKVEVTKDTTPIIEGAGKESGIKTGVKQIRTQTEKPESKYDPEKFQERLAKITAGVGIPWVGARTQPEQSK